jgi:hypothetical protein
MFDDIKWLLVTDYISVLHMFRYWDIVRDKPVIVLLGIHM